ncbi:hypothetical protein ACGTN6_20450 [Halomonas sp. THAF12]|uniref:hypothetical protein n=1 Tax=Halomonas sp. B23F22_10 TaxID=3459515 RepID=UPI00373FBB1F
MAWRFVKQPNGLLAIFSDVVDDFTYVNMTAAQAFDHCKSKHGLSDADAHQKVRAGLDDWKPWAHTVKGSGHDRWDESLRIIQDAHGDLGLKKIMDDVARS